MYHSVLSFTVAFVWDYTRPRCVRIHASIEVSQSAHGFALMWTIRPNQVLLTNVSEVRGLAKEPTGLVCLHVDLELRDSTIPT